MELQFSILSYIAMGVFYFVSGIALLLLWWMIKKHSHAKVIISSLAIVAIVLPWVDELWIAYHFNEACKDAGIHVKRQVVVDGYFDMTTNDNTNDDLQIEAPDFVKRLKSSGYKYMERSTRYGKARHLEAKDDYMVQTILDKPQSRYHYKLTHLHTYAGYKLTKYEEVIWDNVLSENIARDVSYSRYPGWMDSIWMSAYGSGQVICRGDAPQPPKLRRGIPYYAFIPSTDSNVPK